MQKATSTTRPVNSSKKPTQTKRPVKSRVGPFTFKVFYEDDVVDEYAGNSCAAEEAGITLGHTFAFRGKIVVKSNMDPVMERDTVLHEHLHAIWDASGIRTAGNLEEESMVSMLTPWLLMFIRDNPQLVGYLQS